jgi:squalene-hopene/tetraprenyl-beta-curcumene cyclase
VQKADGSWVPLWFGNQDHPGEENPVYGTSKVLLAYRDLGLLDTRPAHRGLAWLRRTQNLDGGWGGGVSLNPDGSQQTISSMEETALALEALLSQPFPEDTSPDGLADGVETRGLFQGLNWLVEGVETGRFRQPSPIGFYFAKLWYHERLYPIIFATSALGRAVQVCSALSAGSPAKSHLLFLTTETEHSPERREPSYPLAPSGKDESVSRIPVIKQPCL